MATQRARLDRSPMVMGLEEECLTVGECPEAIVAELPAAVPAVRARPSGVFTPLGRVYVDLGHVELASAEVDDPFVLAGVVSRLRGVVADAARARGVTLANNNHDGLLRSGAATWGSHENYRVEGDVARLVEPTLPFFATRFYAGSGGVRWPSGAFVASTRVECLTTESGGDTQRSRGLFCTGRSEPGGVGMRNGRRVHLIGADGHRSAENLALQFGVTALVLRVVSQDPDRVAALRGPLRAGEAWLRVAQTLNELAQPGRPLRVPPAAIATQRFYLSMIEGTLEASGPTLPAWAERVCGLWRATLDAAERCDEDWLAQRLDAWAKHRLVSQWLADRDRRWAEATTDPRLAAGVALLCQRYHEFTDPESPHDRLVASGAVRSDVECRRRSRGEAGAWSIATRTRAAARGRAVEHLHGRPGIEMTWGTLWDAESGCGAMLDDVDATRYRWLSPTQSPTID